MADNTWRIGDPKLGGWKGVKFGDSNNDLQPGEAYDMYNCFADKSKLNKRGGYTRDNVTELVTGTGLTGLGRFYNSSVYKTFAKCGTRVYDQQETGNSPYLLTAVTEAGDAGNQMSSWNLVGAGNLNTNGGILYWKLTNSDTTRTVEVYKNSDGLAANLVCSGTRTGDGEVTLGIANSSGISGTVTVAYTIDDTDLAANTLTFPVLSATDEIEFAFWFGNYFFTDGTNVYNGTSGAASELTFQDENGVAITGVHPHGKTILIRSERIWLTRDPNYPTRLYFLLIDSYQKIGCNGGTDVAAWVAPDRDDGQAITGAIRYHDRIFVAKREKTYWVYGEPSDVFPYSGTLQIIDGPAAGAYDQKTIVNCPDGFIRWFGPDGVWQYSDAGGEVHISKDIDFELDQITDSNKIKCCAGWWKHFYLLWYPYDTATYCNRGFAFDTKRGYWYPMRGWNISRFCRFEDDTIHAGWANEGYAVQLFDGTTDNSADVSCYFKTRMECGVPGWEQCLRSIQVMSLRDGQTVTVRWNGDQASPASGEFTDALSIIGTYWGEFTWGDATVPDDGSILVSEDELGSVSTSPFHRMNNSQRFRELYFEIEESGPTSFSFDYLEVRSYLIRQVV